MIRLATVFSGIGAIEHACQRMGLEHEIVFACDNGDVEILTKNIGANIDDIESELIHLSKMIDSVQFNDEVEDLYKDQLANMLHEAVSELSDIKETLSIISFDNNELIMSVLAEILDAQKLKPSQLKEYQKIEKELNSGSKLQSTLRKLQAVLKISNDSKNERHPDPVLLKIKTLYDSFEFVNGKKIIFRVQDLSQRTSQLYEKINYINVQKELESFGDDWIARKKYVDSLYKGQEKRNEVKQSYMANYKLSDDNFHWNVSFLNGRQYRGKVDIFVGGSPCQSFSIAGKQRGLEDTRGTLFYEYARLVDEINPKVFIYENVRAITTNDDGKTWKKIQQVFDELGYTVSWEILNAKNYGVPQSRERVFVVGIRNDIIQNTPYEFPKPIPLVKKLQDLLISDASVPEKYHLSEKMMEYVLATGTKNFHCKPEINLEVAHALLTTMHKMHRAGVDNYVTTSMGGLRRLTPRECLRLMGFSDSFKIVVSDTSMYQQTGNSIVVDVLIKIMEQLFISIPDLKND